VIALHKLAGFDFAWLAKVISLVALPFAHEDLAIVLGGYIIVNDVMPAGLVVASIYGGMVVSDFALYGVGAAARSLPWLRNIAVDQRVRQFSDVLTRNIFGLVALCRLVPGLVFVAFVACGWARVSLARFTAASLLVSAVYLSPMLYLVIVFGDALDNHLGLWAWPVLLLALAAAGFVRERVLAFSERVGTDDTEVGVRSLLRRRMTSIVPARGARRPRALIERIPSWLVHLPLVAHWIVLAIKHRSLTLPSVANPAIPAGGMWGESKSKCLASVSGDMRESVVDFVVLKRRVEPSTLGLDVNRALGLLEAAKIPFPIIARPDVGWYGRGVLTLEGPAALQQYLSRFPGGAKLMLQRSLPHAVEASVLYARLPGEARGQILSFAVRRSRPVLAETGAYLSRELEARIDVIARSMPEFHYGRFEICFPSIEALAGGEDFAIVEINGIGGQLLEFGNPGLSLVKLYRRRLDHQRIAFMIGAYNRERGFAPTSAMSFIGGFLDHYQLTRRYPVSI